MAASGDAVCDCRLLHLRCARCARTLASGSVNTSICSLGGPLGVPDSAGDEEDDSEDDDGEGDGEGAADDCDNLDFDDD
jgi:hypothetical protein